MDQSAWRRQFQEAFKAGGRVLDGGAGSGRDLAALVELGFEAFGTEPAAAMREVALKAYPHLAGRIYPHGLPLPEEADLGGSYDGVICSAVFQHLPEAERFNAAFSLKRLLRENGRLWISVPGDRHRLREQAGRA